MSKQLLGQELSNKCLSLLKKNILRWITGQIYQQCRNAKEHILGVKQGYNLSLGPPLA